MLPGVGVILQAEVKRFLVVGGLAASLAVAGSTHSAPRPPALLTYAVASQSAPGLCLARADGSRRVRLTRRADTGPSWSPGGRYVAFARQTAPGQSQILIADARGRVLRRFGTGLSIEPSWSPDGRRIAYSAGNRVIVAGTAGRVFAEIEAFGLAGGPTWSPNSRRLAFAQVQELEIGTLRQISVVNADGSGRRLLIRSATDPAWSRDGSRIAYVAYLSRLSETGNIAVARADGTGARRLTTSAEAEASPAWSPGGARIAFVRGRSVLVANASGGGERVAVRGAFDPAWRPAVALAQVRRSAC
jgi:Tol biopolymer transport system component